MKVVSVNSYISGNSVITVTTFDRAPDQINQSTIHQGEVITRDWIERFSKRVNPVEKVMKAMKDLGRQDLVDIVQRERDRLAVTKNRISLIQIQDLLFPSREVGSRRPIQKALEDMGITERNYSEKLPDLYAKYPTLSLLCKNVTEI